MEDFSDISLRLEVYGTRGSNSIFSDEFTKYGGSTSCYLIETNDGDRKEAIILDAGTGLYKINDIDYDEITILLSHSHLDHILGLPVFPYLSKENKKVNIYLAKRNDVSAKEQIDGLISEPYWPCRISDYKAKVGIFDMPESFDIGGVHVDTMESNHPGGSSIIRLGFRGSNFVYATDYEHGDVSKEKELAAFAKGADLLFYDAQYFEDEYSKYKGYGHSTPEEGIRLKEESGAKELVFIHHSPAHNDLCLYEAERKYIQKGAHFAREVEVFYL